MNEQKPIIELKNISAGYTRIPVIREISGTFNKGTLTAIVGPNGSGKSTLLKVIAGIIKPQMGKLKIFSQDGKKPRISYLPQSTDLDRSFPITVFDVVSMGLWHKVGPFSSISSAQRQQTLDALRQAGMAGYEKNMVAELSGGQFQRVLFARLIVEDADVLLLDEPFSAIDMTTILSLMDLIKQWVELGKTVIVVHHDLNLVRQYFPLTVIIRERIICWDTTTHVLEKFADHPTLPFCIH